MSSKATFGGGGGSSGRGQQDGGGRLNSPCGRGPVARGIHWTMTGPGPGSSRIQVPGPASSAGTRNRETEAFQLTADEKGFMCHWNPLDVSVIWDDAVGQLGPLPCNKSSRNPVNICKVRSA